MKNLCLFLVFLFSLISNSYAQEWIPYQTPVVQPIVQYQVYQPQPVVVYQLVPYIVQQNILIEKHCLFHRTQTLVTRPVLQYVYQPVIIYQ